MKQLLVLIAVFSLPGCFEEAGKKAADYYGVSTLSVWAISDGQLVDIGGDTVSIIGTDNCNTGFGSSYSCWKFSLVPGQKQLVSLSNGLQETWTTEDAGKSRVYLVRPNGFKVIAK